MLIPRAAPMTAATTRVTLVRHGETEWSVNGRHTGRTDIALTACGEDEARALEPLLRGTRFGRVFTSPAARARRTCALAGLEADVDPDLAEWDYGDYEGQRSREIGEARPGWSVYRDGCPGGESPMDVSTRADRLIARLRSYGGAVALFSHGQFGCGLAARWIGLSIGAAEHLQLGTAALSVLGFDPNHPDVPVIVRWNMQPGLAWRAGDVVPMGDAVEGAAVTAPRA